MKNIGKYIPFLMFVLALGFNSCSDDSNIEVIDAKVTTSEFLNDYYSKSHRIGNSKNIYIEKFSTDLQQKSVQFDDYLITEVFVGDETVARGYIFENAITNEAEVFVDVDRTNFIATSIDLKSNDVESVSNINQLPEYSDSNGFDLIGAIDNGDGQNTTNGWRYELVAPCHAEYRGGEFIGYYETINARRYTFGFIRTANHENLSVPCGTFGFLTR